MARRALAVRGEERRVVVRRVPGPVGVEVVDPDARRIAVAGAAVRRARRSSSASRSPMWQPAAGPVQVPNVPPFSHHHDVAAAAVRDRQGPRQVDRPVGVRAHRRRRVAVRAVRRRVVLRVRLRRQRRRVGAVALRAAVRPAAEHRVPRVRRAAPPRSARCCGTDVDPAAPEGAAVHRHHVGPRACT